MLSVMFSLIGMVAVGQSPAAYTPDLGNVGFPTNGVFSGGSIDSVQLANGNLHVDIPLLHLPGIGMDSDIHLTYDSAVWNIQQGPYLNGNEIWNLITMSRPHWQLNDPMAGFLKWGMHQVMWQCNVQQYPNLPNSGTSVYIDYVSFTDGNGTAHRFPVKGMTPSVVPPQQCYSGTIEVAATNVMSSDASGYHLVLNNQGGIVSLTDKQGTNYYFTQTQITGSGFQPGISGGPPSNPSGGLGTPANPTSATTFIWSQVTAMEDSNGNRISCCTTGNSFVDSVGRTIAETNGGVEFDQPGVNMTMESMGPQVQSISYQDQNNQAQTITITYEDVSINLPSLCPSGAGATNCGTVVGTQASATVAQLPHQIRLQNGDIYQIDYVDNDQGEISSITLPTGGIISYTWTCCSPNAGSPPTPQLIVASRTVSTNEQEAEWYYGYDLGLAGAPHTLTTTITNPDGNDTAVTFDHSQVTSETLYKGRAASNLPIVTKTMGYTAYACLTDQTSLVTSEVITWNESGETTEADTSYDGPTCTRGNVTQKAIYDYGTGGAHGPLLSNTVYSYLHNSNSAYANANIADRVSQVSVYNSLAANSSTLVAQTTTNYDQFNQTSQNGQSGLTTASGTTQHDYTNYGVGQTLRGLPTSVSKYTSPGSSAIVTYVNYNVLGKETVATDARGSSTRFTYGAQNAFITAVQLPDTTTTGTTIHHVIPQFQDPNTGLMIWKGTQNSSPSTGQLSPSSDATQYTYDNRMRVLTETRPDGGITTNHYRDPNDTVSTVTEDTQRTATSTIVLDGIGRRISTSSTADSACGTLTVDTGYDLLGRVAWVSNPHCVSGLSTDGYTTYSYDPIGRLSNKQNPDGSSQAWTFKGSTIDFYDEMGDHWQHTYDASDRLIKVLEPDGSTDVNASPTMETDYSYDTLGNLVRVDQWGGPHGTSGEHVRQFAYDAVSRLLASNNPESASATQPAALTCSNAPSGTLWTGCYVYDPNGNVTKKTDNRGISINYSYDALNRVLSKTYSDSTPSVTFQYDTSPITGASYDIGALTFARVAAGASTLAQTNPYAYDPAGRLMGENQCTPANCGVGSYQLGYTYDLVGKVTGATFPSNAPGNGLQAGQPLTLSYSYDVAERLLSATSSWFASGDATHPGVLFQASGNSSLPAYGPMGLQNATVGFDPFSGTTTATLQRGYDERGRVLNGVYVAGNTAIQNSSSAGSIVISGSEKQKTATLATSSVVLTDPTVAGTFGSRVEKCFDYSNTPPAAPTEHDLTAYYTGTITVNIQSAPQFGIGASWGSTNESASAVRSNLVNQLNVSTSPVNATLNGNNTITLTSKASGFSANYPVIVSVTQGALDIEPAPQTGWQCQ